MESTEKKVFTRKHAEELITDFATNCDNLSFAEIDNTLQAIFEKMPHLKLLGIDFADEIDNMSCGDLEEILLSMSQNLTDVPFKSDGYIVFDEIVDLPTIK